MSRERRSGANKPRPIAPALTELLAERGLDDDVARAWVIEAWPGLVGTQIASVTSPRLVTEDGTLVVGVKTHGWMSELSLMERSLVTRINAGKDGKRSPVRRIRWELLR
jgi:predicted nucleic acid-binding Zn ribbon protein